MDCIGETTLILVALAAYACGGLMGIVCMCVVQYHRTEPSLESNKEER